MDASGAGLTQSLEAKQSQDRAAIQQAASAITRDAAIVQGRPWPALCG